MDIGSRSRESKSAELKKKRKFLSQEIENLSTCDVTDPGKPSYTSVRPPNSFRAGSKRSYGPNLPSPSSTLESTRPKTGSRKRDQGKTEFQRGGTRLLEKLEVGESSPAHTCPRLVNQMDGRDPCLPSQRVNGNPQVVQLSPGYSPVLPPVSRLSFLLRDSRHRCTQRDGRDTHCTGGCGSE